VVRFLITQIEVDNNLNLNICGHANNVKKKLRIVSRFVGIVILIKMVHCQLGKILAMMRKI
jgi:hypothetical protein